MERLLGFDAQLLFDSAVTAFNVILLFAVLSAKLFNPVRNYLAERQERIAGRIKDSEKAREQALAMKAEYEAKLRGVRQEAEQILKEAARKAGEQAVITAAKAKEEAREIYERAVRDAELEKEKAREEMRSELISVAAAMALNVISGMMDGHAQKEMVEKITAEMGKKTWQS